MAASALPGRDGHVYADAVKSQLTRARVTVWGLAAGTVIGLAAFLPAALR